MAANTPDEENTTAFQLRILAQLQRSIEKQGKSADAAKEAHKADKKQVASYWGLYKDMKKKVEAVKEENTDLTLRNRLLVTENKQLAMENETLKSGEVAILKKNQEVMERELKMFKDLCKLRDGELQAKEGELEHAMETVDYWSWKYDELRSDISGRVNRNDDLPNTNTFSKKRKLFDEGRRIIAPMPSCVKAPNDV